LAVSILPSNFGSSPCSLTNIITPVNGTIVLHNVSKKSYSDSINDRMVYLHYLQIFRFPKLI
jgi:hypothetical protein